MTILKIKIKIKPTLSIILDKLKAYLKSSNIANYLHIRDISIYLNGKCYNNYVMCSLYSVLCIVKTDIKDISKFR